MGKLKKFAKGVGAFIWTIHVAPLGAVSAIIEEATKIDGGNFISDLAYQGKSAAFNSVRKAWGKDHKTYDEATGTTSEQLMKKREADIRRAAAAKGVPKEKVDVAVAGFRSSSTPASGVKRVKYQAGASWNNTAFVFSCPGQTELRMGSVCAGTTGVNLSMVLEYCNKRRPDVFPSDSKSDYLITNASDIVHFKSLTNDTEASDEEVSAAENLRRLRDELSGKSIIICMGERAAKAVREAGIRGRIVFFDHHLSNQKLNRAYTNDQFDESLSPAERRAERIRLVAEDLLKCV